MKKFVSYLMIFMLATLSLNTGCSTISFSSKKGTIKIGMKKEEVLAIWGNPRDETPPAKTNSLSYNEDRYEFWEYPPGGWFGNAVLVTFNKDGIVTDIETLYK